MGVVHHTTWELFITLIYLALPGCSTRKPINESTDTRFN